MATPPTTRLSYTARALAPLRGPIGRPVPANMNGAPTVSDEILVDTLRHFGEYGLGAAAKALETAEAELRSGNVELGQHWLEIGRALDRRRASQLERELCNAE